MAHQLLHPQFQEVSMVYGNYNRDSSADTDKYYFMDGILSGATASNRREIVSPHNHFINYFSFELGTNSWDGDTRYSITQNDVDLTSTLTVTVGTTQTGKFKETANTHSCSQNQELTFIFEDLVATGASTLLNACLNIMSDSTAQRRSDIGIWGIGTNETIAVGETNYFGASSRVLTTEDKVETVILRNETFKNWHIKIRINNNTGANDLIFTVRKNNIDQFSTTIGAGQSGHFQDLDTVVKYHSGDIFSMLVDNSAGDGTIGFTSYCWSGTENTSQMCYGDGAATVNIAAGATEYGGINGKQDWTAIRAQHTGLINLDLVIDEMDIKILANASSSGDCVFKVADDLVNLTPSITVGAGQTGRFSTSESTTPILADSNIDIEGDNSAGNGIVTVGPISMSFRRPT